MLFSILSSRVSGCLFHQRPEAAERRRVEAAAELERQKEQEEWDRAFEEELVQTGLPEDVVAACVYQILGVSQRGRQAGVGAAGVGGGATCFL